MAYMLNSSPVTSDIHCGQYNVSTIKLKRIRDIVIEGIVTNCNNKPLSGILVKAFEEIEGEPVGITHSYTGCNGHYMLNVPHGTDITKVTIMAASSSCGKKRPCEPCPEEDDE